MKRATTFAANVHGGVSREDQEITSTSSSRPHNLFDFTCT